MPTDQGADRPQARHLGTLESPAGFETLVSIGLGPDGPAAIWSSPDGADRLMGRTENEAGVTFANTRAEEPPAVALARYADDMVTPWGVVEMAGLPVAFPDVQPLHDGGYLVVGARCRWRPAGPEQNALLIDPDGRITARGCLGDGIEHLQVGEDGTIWAGYFDEGVIGNFGWGGPGPEPLGAGGIVQWSRDFKKLWEQPPHEGLIVDCYALNVTADAVWACTYTDFPVLRIAGGRTFVHLTYDVSGPRGIVTHGDRVGLIGSYDDPSLLITGQVGGGGWVEGRRGRLWTPDGTPVAAGWVHCRGSEAHFFVGREWYVYDLADEAG